MRIHAKPGMMIRGLNTYHSIDTVMSVHPSHWGDIVKVIAPLVDEDRPISQILTKDSEVKWPYEDDNCWRPAVEHP